LRTLRDIVRVIHPTRGREGCHKPAAIPDAR